MDTSFLAADLKMADPDRYLLSLYCPRRVRPLLWALFLFNHEIVRTREMVTNTNLGLIRLQWWRDEIAKIYAGGGGGQIPILSTLAPAIHAGGIPQDWFDTLIYAHEFDLEDVAPATFFGLANYADFTTTPLTKIALKLIGEEEGEDEIRGISTFCALIQLVRAIPKHLSQRRCFIPEDWLAEKGLSAQRVIDFNHKDDILKVLLLNQSLFESYRKSHFRPKSVFLTCMEKMTSIQLNSLKKMDFDVFSPKAQISPPFLALRLLIR